MTDQDLDRLEALLIERRWIVKMTCADCGHILNTSVVFENLDALCEAWTMMIFSGGMCAGRCPKGCRSTFSDLNINTRMHVHDADTDEYFSLRDIQLRDLPRRREALPESDAEPVRRP